jgi:tRNA threonylcarbamoyladenosine biosynthesis protein TsaB
MLVLAIDSSTRAGSLALARHDHLLEVCHGDAATRHAVRLPGDVVSLLARHDLALRDVDLLAATAGPGGFTGLRVGLATVQGLAMALDRRVFVASTLDLIATAAAAALPQAAWVGAWMHGMRGEIFTSLHRRMTPGAAALDIVVSACVGTPDEVAAQWRAAAPNGVVAVAGDGWPDAGAALRAAVDAELVGVSIPPLAATLALRAAAHADEAVGAAAVRPTYVRRPDAVLTRERSGLPAPGAD